MTAFDDWLDGMLPPDAPMRVRRAVEREQEGRLGDAYEAADDRRRSAVMRVAADWDLVLDMLTVMAMDGVYGRNQEERLASLLIAKRYGSGAGSEPGIDYNTLEAVLARFRTHVVPEEECGCCGYGKPPCRTGRCDHEVWDDVNGVCIGMTAFDRPLREADGTDPGGDDDMDDRDGRRPGI